MEDCIFCKIINGDAPASIVYEDDIVIAFMAIEQVNDGHVLVTPKQHFTGLSDLDEAIGTHLFTVAHRTARAIRQTDIKCEGINLWLADGEAAFQSVFHVHLHVFPRFEGDDYTVKFDWDYRAPRPHLDNIATKIRTAFKNI